VSVDLGPNELLRMQLSLKDAEKPLHRFGWLGGGEECQSGFHRADVQPFFLAVEMHFIAWRQVCRGRYSDRPSLSWSEEWSVV
jgi:hypothetical protein